MKTKALQKALKRAGYTVQRNNRTAHQVWEKAGAENFVIPQPGKKEQKAIYGQLARKAGLI